MSKFNSLSKGSKTVNLAGGEAFQESPKLEFVSILLTSFVKDQFYRSESEGLERVRELINKLQDKLFIAKAAVYARTKFGMRSISHVVAGEIAKNVKKETWTKRFFNRVIHRPDDMSEILSYYITNYKKPIPNSLKKGLAEAITRFDEYALSKYRGENKEVSLVDIVNLVRPKHTEAIGKLIKGTLKAPETWEVGLTQAGQKASTEEEKVQNKREVWTKLISEKKLGYFALLRNLRNICEQAPEMVPEACEMLLNEQAIRKSLVLPFRFISAYQEMQHVPGAVARRVIITLNQALELSMANVPTLDGETLVALDISGSMGGNPTLIGSLFAAVLAKKNNSDIILFNHDAQYVSINPTDSLTTIAKQLSRAEGSTNFRAIFEKLNRAYKRIIILSDMQGWDGYNAPTGVLNDYKKKYLAFPKVYSIDLAGHGTLQFPERDVFCLAGFSEKIFDIMKLLEQDKQALINEIEKVEI